MSRFMLMEDLFLEVENVNLSSFVRNARLIRSHEQRETTGISDKWRSYTVGPAGAQLQVQWWADFANNASYRTLYDLQGEETFVQFNPYTRGRSASRPRHQFNVVVTGMDAINAVHGRPSSFSTSWPVTGEIRRSPSAYFLTRMRCGLANVGGDIVLGWARAGDLADGSIDDQVVSRLVVPGAPARNLDIRQISYNRTDRDLDLIFTDAEDAVAVAGHWLVVGEVVFHMTGSPNITNGWRLTNVDDPGWDEFQRVKIELWGEDPES